MKSRQRPSRDAGVVGRVVLGLAALALLAGCAATAKEFDPAISAPQILVEPETIRLGVSRVMGTEFVIRGKGFQPGDSVFIELADVPKGDKVADIPIFDAEVGANGEFTAASKAGYDPAGLTFKIGVLLRAKTGQNEKGETTLVIYQPPIPQGTYLVRAVSMEADRTADAEWVIKGPSLWDSCKDSLGRMLGKIVKE